MRSMNSIGLIRRLLVAGIVLWQSHSAMAQTDSFDLYVSYTDSVEVSLDLANLRSLKFSYSARTMTANYRNGSSQTYDYSRMDKMYFAASSGIEVVNTEDKLYTLNGTTLTLSEEAQIAVLYRLDGTQVITIANREAELRGLQPGIYILRVDNQTAKLCVR